MGCSRCGAETVFYMEGGSTCGTSMPSTSISESRPTEVSDTIETPLSKDSLRVEKKPLVYLT